MAPSAHPLRAILFLMVAVMLFVLLDSTVKQLAQRYPVLMLAWVRYVVHLVLMTVFLAPRLGRRLILSARPRLQVLRASFLLGTTCLGMAALRVLPIAEATALTFASPLLVTLLAQPVLGETVSRQRWLAVLVGFAGMLLIVRPGGGLVALGVVLGLANAVSYSGYQLLTRRLSDTENPITLLFYTALVGSVGTSLALPWGWGGPTPDLRDALMMLSLGIYGGAGHFLLIRAFREAPASLLSPILFVQLAWATLAGWLLFGHIPDAITLAGICTIAGAGVMIALESRRTRRAGLQRA